MELLIAILIALGSFTTSDGYTDDWAAKNQETVDKAQQIIESGAYHYDDSTGGVVVDAVII